MNGARAPFTLRVIYAVAPDGWQADGVSRVAECTDINVWSELRWIVPLIFSDRKQLECHRMLQAEDKAWMKLCV